MPSAAQSQVLEIKNDLGTVKKDISRFERYYEKVNSVMEEIKTVITTHDSKLSLYHDDIVEVKQKMETQGEKISDSITSMKQELLHEIIKTREESDSRIRTLEYWRYIIAGGAIIIGLFATTLFQNIMHKAIEPAIAPTTIELQQHPEK